MEKAPTGHHCQLDSGIVTTKPAFLRSINVTAVGSGDSVEVYNGTDAIGGSKVMRVKTLANVSQHFSIPGDLFCERGIYALCSASDTEWSVFYCYPKG